MKQHVLLVLALSGALAVEIKSPKFNGYPLDFCLDFEKSCGFPAADYYCRQMGYQGASSFKGPVQLNQGTTIIAKTSGTCDTELHPCGTFESIDCKANKAMFRNPQFKGFPVDVCLEFENSCFQPAADYFCTLNGFARASAYGKDVKVTDRKTVLPKSGQTCTPGVHPCGTFEYIECSN